MAAAWRLGVVILLGASCNRAAPPPVAAADLLVAAPDLTGAAGDLATGPAGDLATGPAGDLALLPDLLRAPDLAAAGCKADKDCRLYSNTCAAVKPNPCVCIPLRAAEADPPCMGPRVLCDTDPCEGHQPGCDLMTGRCVVR